MQKMGIRIEKARLKAVKLCEELEKLKNQKIPTQEYAEISEHIEKTRSSLNKLRDEQDRKMRLGETSGAAWDRLQLKIEDAGNTIKYAEGELKALVDTGKAFRLGSDTDEFRQKTEQLKMANAELAALNTKKQEMTEGFEQASRSAKKLFKNIRSDAGKSNSILSTMVTRLKGIALSLLVFNWITKGFNAMIGAMKEGFKNLAQYSSDYNRQMSALKSGAAQLKNGLAAAFEPIVNMAVPYLVQLIGWLNKAVDTIAQFLAALSGKSTYTRAKKQTIDYAKSLDTASKSAKRALASFDQLNVLSKKEGDGNTEGEKTGADAFETVKIDEGIFKTLEKAKKILHQILPLVKLIGLAFLAWRIFKFLGELGEMKSGLKDIIGLIFLVKGCTDAIPAFFDMWENGVDWENLQQYAIGAGEAILGLSLLFGPLGAGIGLIIFGVAGMALALKDMMDNGINAQNVTLMLGGALGTLLGILLVFGAPVAAVAAAVMAVIGALGAMIVWTGNGEEALATLKGEFEALLNFVKHVFEGDWEAAFADIMEFSKLSLNMGNITFESFVNAIIKGINLLIDSINSIKIKIPDFVPGIGGEEFSPSIPNITWNLSMPRLAEGAVIPGGKPFAAILGDQRRGQTNIETPLNTMLTAFRQALAENGGTGGGNYTFTAQLDGRTLFSETVRMEKMNYKSTGRSVFMH